MGWSIIIKIKQRAYIEVSVNLFLNEQEKAITALRLINKDIINVVDKVTLKLKNSKDSRIIYCGAGTSGRIGVQDGVELYPTFGWPKNRIDFILAGGMKSLTESIENAEDDRSHRQTQIETSWSHNQKRYERPIKTSHIL